MSKGIQAGGRTLRHLRKLGYHADKVEQYITPVAGKDYKPKFAGGYRRDPFGFMDVLAFRRASSSPGPVGHEEWGLETPPVTLAVQCTTRQQITKHLRDYRRDPEIRRRILDWIACRNVFVIHGWWKENVSNKAGTGTYVRWRVEELQVTPEMLELTRADVAAELKRREDLPEESERLAELRKRGG